MEFNYNLASTSTSIAMIGALLSFAGVGLLILILSERMFHGLSKLFYFFGNQILISRRLFSKKYIEENKASHNQLYKKQIEITQNELSLTEQKERLEKILKMKV
jgi:predicted lipid-binding transport protein (Tim44 family)|tara:strand:- start:830 stop:1141 length:312 start_codon:yes stop_codon:yes gene_type:complete